MQTQRPSPFVAALGVSALTAILVGTVMWPRIAQLKTAVSNSWILTVLAVLLAVAALVPLAAIDHSRIVKPAILSIVALGLGCGLVLSFNERDGSDGLFVLVLILGTLIILTTSTVMTVQLRRAGSEGALPRV